MRCKPLFVFSTLAMGLAIMVPAIAQAQVRPDASCTGSPQRCDVTFQNQEPSGLYLGNSGGNAIVFTADGGQGQRWDVYQVSGNEYAIYNNGTNNVLARGGGCTANGGSYTYCAVVQPASSPLASTQEWYELRTDPMVFENADSGSRCLDDPGGNAPAGSRAVLYPCNTSDLGQQWAGS